MIVGRNLGLVCLALAIGAGCAAGNDNNPSVVDPDASVEDTGKPAEDTGEKPGDDAPVPSFDVPVDRGAAPDVPELPDAPATPDTASDAGAPDAGAPDVGTPDAGCVAVCNGTCTDTSTDPRNCGACGQDCALRPGANPARVTCIRGACVFGTGACVAGRGDCDGDATNGCEAIVNSATRCGSCSEGCREPTPYCAMVSSTPSGYACSSGCVSPTPTRCGTSCVDTATDVRNCGACGTVCPTGGTGSSASCTGGRCALTCVTGYGDCDGVAANGCEVSTRTSPLHCGACGNACGGGVNATAVCSAGACALTCSAGYGNCDGMASTGCETDTRANVMNCGGCGLACAARANATPTCTSGACNFVCTANFGNCDAVATNGCEVDLRTNPANCGACARRCAAQSNATATCADGVCGLACTAGYGDCDGNGLNGCEASFALDANNCGACGTRCPSAPNATPACAGSRCGLTCAAGFGDCDGTTSNGCETATTTSMAHCGACGRACNAPANATAACAASVCVVTCNAGYTLSAGTCVRTPPRTVSPGAFGFVTSQTPTFRVALPGGGQDGAFVEVCGNRTCTSVAATATFAGSSGAVTAVLAPGTYFWRVSGRVGGAVATAPSTPSMFYVAAAQRPAVSAAWGSVLDANADGSPELLSGAPGSNQARLYPGGPSGLSTVFTTLSGGTGYGAAVAALGDVNGDGYADAAVGEPAQNRVYLYLGAAGGLGTAPVVLVAPAGNTRFGAAVAGAGDVNGDGFSDVLVGVPGSNRVYLYLGSAQGIAADAVGVSLSAAASNYGVAVAGLGDVNADGYADAAVGTDGPNTVYVYLGSPSGLGTSLLLSAPGGASGFGFAVAAAGDVTSDGYPDVVVGAYGAQTAYVFAGGASGVALTPAVTIPTPAAGVQFGWSVDGVGDVTGDGYGDVLVGAPMSERAYLFAGSPAGLGTTPAQTYAPAVGVTGTQLGRAVARLGDVNRNGVFDFVIGQPGRYTVQVFQGALTPTLLQTFSHTTTTSQFGASFAR